MAESKKPAPRRAVGAVEKATRADIALIAATDPRLAASGLAATALALSRELDDAGNSATSKSMCAKALMDALDRLRELAPPQKEESELERKRRERSERRRSSGGTAAPD
jgi:hypothetical protein